jgi:hypothetical protein
VSSRPILRTFDKSFLDSVAEDVLETVDLGLGFVADDNALVSAPPELLLPLIEASGLASQVRIYIAHKAGDLLSILNRNQKMKMVREKNERMELDSVQALGSGEDSDGDGVELLGGAQEQSSLEGPPGDLDDSTAFWDEPDGSSHGGEPEGQELCQPGASRPSFRKYRQGRILEAFRKNLVS